jgi:hypothetical protein
MALQAIEIAQDGLGNGDPRPRCSSANSATGTVIVGTSTISLTAEVRRVREASGNNASLGNLAAKIG